MKIDKEKIEKAIRLFLEGIGEDPDREGRNWRKSRQRRTEGYPKENSKNVGRV